MPNRYQSLDGMRGLCAVIVAAFHFDRVLNTGHLLNHGWLSVDIFFVISGFIIAHVYEQRLLDGAPLSEFLRARIRRLLPVQIVGAAIVAATYFLLFATGRIETEELTWPALFTAAVFSVLLLQMQFSPFGKTFTIWNPSFPLNPPLWSLQGEWLINLIYGRWLFGVRAAVLFAIFVLLAVYLFYAVVFPVDYGTLPPSLLPDVSRASAGFIAGVLIFRANAVGLLVHLPRISSGLVYGVWFFICALPNIRPTPILEMLVSVIVAPSLVMLLVRGERPVPKWLLALGTLSYPLYASHFAVINLASIWFGISSARHSALFALPMLGSALMLALLIDLITKLLSTPIRRMKQGRF